MKNKYPAQHDTHERQHGGNTPVEGESHGQKKATRITEDQRYDGAENSTLVNSPGRQSSDVRDKS